MVAIVLHLYYQELWNELKEKIQPLLNDDVHLYVTINEETEYTNDIRLFAKEVFMVKNKGMDYGPFVYVWNKIKDMGYEYVLKIHGKKSEYYDKKFGSNFGIIWRMQLVQPLIKSKDRFYEIISFMKENDNVYMAGSERHFYDTYREPIDHVNRMNCVDKIDKLMNHVDSFNHGCFFAGSMFIVKSDYLHKFFNGCDLDLLYEEFEESYSPNSDLLAHAMERVICYGVEKHSGKFLTLSVN
jgi:lipopolysaccharide biosynthesis protein